MGYFRFKSISTEGKLRSGLIDMPFDNPMSAIAYLERQGEMVLFAQPLPRFLGAVLDGGKRFFTRRIEPDDLAEALSNLAVMLRAGIPVLSALRDVFAAAEHPTLAAAGRDIVARIEAGSSLSEAASAFPWLFPPAVLFLMRVGESSGSLERTMKDAAEHVKRSSRIRKDAKRGLIYPAFMFLAIFGAIGVWLYVVVPTMVDLFKQMHVEVPVLTRVVIAASTLLIGYFPYVVGAVVLTIVSLRLLIARSRRARYLLHASLLRLPIIGMIIRIYNLAFLSEYLSLLLAAGLDIMRAIDTIMQSLPNEVFKSRLTTVREALLNGLGVRVAFQRAEVFPQFVVRMVGVGEESGTLEEQLRYVAEEYQYRLNTVANTIGKIIEPIALIVGGGIFVLLAVALFMPLYKLIGSIGRH